MLEDIFQTHNASAVLRNRNCFNLQDTHMIKNSNELITNLQIALGSSQWLNIHRYNSENYNTLSIINKLKKRRF
jgi:tRNA (guanosine-2'-O-)-methyltransferase